MSLFTTMTPADGGNAIGFGVPLEQPYEVRFTATVEGRAVATAGLTRAGGSVRATVAANADLHKRILELLAAQ